MRLMLRLEVLVGSPVLAEDARRRVAHDGILGLVRALKYAVKRLQLLLCQARLCVGRCNGARKL